MKILIFCDDIYQISHNTFGKHDWSNAMYSIIYVVIYTILFVIPLGFSLVSSVSEIQDEKHVNATCLWLAVSKLICKIYVHKAKTCEDFQK